MIFLAEKKEQGSKSESGMPVFDSEAQKVSPRDKWSRRGESVILLGVALILVATFFLNTAVFASTELAIVFIFVLGIALIIGGVVYRKSKLGHV